MVTPELRHLRYFLAVAEELNFTRAAERLHVAQPALSAQVRQLERHLGVQLLHRTTREVRLTTAGAVVYEHGRRALDAVEDVWTLARRLGKGEAGKLCLAYNPSSGYDTTPRLVAELRRHAPELVVEAAEVASAQLMERVRNGAADAALARYAEPVSGLRIEVIRHDPVGVLVHETHPFTAHAELPVSTLSTEVIRLHERSSSPGHYDAVVAMCRAAGFEPRLAAPHVAFDPTMSGIAAGEAVGVVGRSAGRRPPVGVRWVALATPAAAIPIALVTAEVPAPAVDTLLRVARSVAVAEGWLDPPAP